MANQIIGIPSSVYRSAIRTLFDLNPLQTMIFTFGVSIVLIFTILHLWKHVKEGQP